MVINYKKSVAGLVWLDSRIEIRRGHFSSMMCGYAGDGGGGMFGKHTHTLGKYESTALSCFDTPSNTSVPPVVGSWRHSEKRSVEHHL